PDSHPPRARTQWDAFRRCRSDQPTRLTGHQRALAHEGRRPRTGGDGMAHQLAKLPGILHAFAEAAVEKRVEALPRIQPARLRSETEADVDARRALRKHPSVIRLDE